ncbi:MAG TPA: hypothetical protein VIK33_14090 [Anaerolineae bacterium]
MTTELPPIVPTDDFWSRRANAQTHVFECAPYGIPATISSNDEGVLAAARLSAARYSRSDIQRGRPIRIRCIVADRGPREPIPDDLADRLVYSGLEDWITLSAGEWGRGFANLQSREACVFLSPALAHDARFVSRYFLDHYVLNMVLTEWAMLHASCAFDVERQRLIVMVATHNIGKSTTALRLARAGYAFLADGMALLQREGDSLVVGGYPIGEVKLRDDVLAWFPEYRGQAVHAREQQKTIVNLRAAHPSRIVETLITPASIHLCFVERHAAPETRVAVTHMPEVLPIVAANTAYWNDAARLEHNTITLHHLLRIASLHRLYLGSDPDGIIAAVNQLTN